MKLYEAFNIVPGDVVALVGAGGKTSTLISLGHELGEAGWRVLATTTTGIDEEQLALMPCAHRADEGANLISESLGTERFVFVYDDVRSGPGVALSLKQIPWLLDSIDADVLLIEADAARGLPFKAPYAQEPVIPPETSLVIPVASLTALGQPLDDQHIYNAKAMIERYGFYEGSPVKSPWMAQVLRDRELGLRGVPPKARVMVWLNGTPANGYLRARGRLIARLILREPRVYGVAMGSARALDPVCEMQRPIGAVVLAAGMSRRMGQMKVLMPWTGGKTILEHILEQLILARVDHVVVVAGNRADEVKAAAQRLDVPTVINPDFENGEMLSSLKSGLRALPAHIGAALVVLGDQPRIQPRIIGQVLMAYAEGAGDIIAPSFHDQRGHPVLIDRRYWQEILALPPDRAPRDVINAHPERTALIPVDDDGILGDVDTPQDYARERGRAGLG